jgi:membrane protein DedA with SNARE-associated domain
MLRPLEAHLQSLIAYFSAHPQLALGAVFAASLLEAAAVIGTVIPGSTIVFAAGVLVGLKALDPWLAAATAIIGAILGDSVSYWLGHRYHDAIRGMWPLRKHPGLLDRGQAYFVANGGKSVFVGRFLGPLRAIVPVVAGMSNMPPSRFYVMNVLSAFAWAAAHLLPGILFGASLQVAGAISSRLVTLVALIVTSLWLITYVTRHAIRLGGPFVVRLRDRIYLRAGRASGPLARLVLPLLDPARPESVSLLVSATLLVGGAWLFLGVVEDVVTKDTLVQVDQVIYDWLQGVRTAWGDDVLVTISELGSAYVMVAIVGALSLWFALTRRWRTLAYWIAAVVFAELLVLALKYALGRARPETSYASVDPFSFPSGHAALWIVVYGFLAFLLGHRKSGWQKTAFALGAATTALLVAFSRLYLGAHWFSDVLASMGLGIAWIALLSIAYITHVHERPLRAAPVLIIVLSTLTFFGGSYAGSHHARDLARYAKPDTLRTLSFDGWSAGEWRQLPPVRSEIGGAGEEPFSVQWVAAAAEISALLSHAGWQSPSAWRSRAALLWLLPTTPIGDLPVLPKLNRGRAAAITFVKPIDDAARTVIRLWHVADVVEAGGASARPLWSGMVTIERRRTEGGLVVVARTATDFTTPLRQLERDVQGAHVASETGERGAMPVLRIW